MGSIAVSAILLIATSVLADARPRHRPKHPHRNVAVDAPQPQQLQWYVGEYPYPYLMVDAERFSRCRVGWWQSSSMGRPRPQWATLCQR